jgi:hypothetical protein
MQLPLEPPPITGDVLLVPARRARRDCTAPPARPAPKVATRPPRTSSAWSLVVAVIAAVAVVLALSLVVPELAPAQPSPAAATAPARAITAPLSPKGKPSWPRSEPAATADAWQPATIQFPDGSGAALYPDRVRSPAGRSIAITVERFAPGGAPMSGVLDMELVVDTPGRAPYKAGLTEDADAPGTYTGALRADELGIGRTDVQLIASQTARPNDPGPMGAAVTTVEIVGGVRFAGPPVARWDGERLLIDIRVGSRTRAHATASAELRAGDAVLCVVTGEADVPEGESTITLDVGGLVRPGDPRAAELALADGTLLATIDGVDRWTDFWRGPRALPVEPIE